MRVLYLFGVHSNHVQTSTALSPFTTKKASGASFAQWQVPTPSKGFGSSPPDVVCTATANSKTAQPTQYGIKWYSLLFFAVVPCCRKMWMIHLVGCPEELHFCPPLSTFSFTFSWFQQTLTF